jgi:hypothetical protein
MCFVAMATRPAATALEEDYATTLTAFALASMDTTARSASTRQSSVKYFTIPAKEEGIIVVEEGGRDSDTG